MIEEILETAKKCALMAGDILKYDFRKIPTLKQKGLHDVVTDTDLRSEATIIGTIRRKFPEHKIISEEAGTSENNSDYCWYIDPLDGTSNFITGNPYFTVSIGISFQGRMVAGVVFNPVMDEMYFAMQGKGAWLNDTRISVSKQKNINEALIATAYSAEETDIENGIILQRKLALTARRVVVNFAPALDLCNIARGRIDGLVDNGSTPEDHAGASIILSEAGGKIQNMDSENWDFTRTGIIASNGNLHQTLAALCH